MSLFGKPFQSFSKFHPGGCYNLELAAASTADEARMLFLSYHTGKDRNKIKEIAALNDFNNIPKMSQTSLLQHDIQRLLVKVQRKYAIHGRIYKLYASLLVLLLIFSIVYNIFNSCLWNIILLSFTITSYSFVVFHTRHHLGGNLFIKNCDFFRLFFDHLDNLLMIPPKQWLFNHQLSHHIYPNSTRDYDLITPFPFLRLASNFGQSYIHKYQWSYGLFLFMLNGFTFSFKNVTASKKWDKDRVNNINVTDGNWMYFVAYYLILVILPIAYNGVYALQMYCIAISLCGVTTAILFQISHHVTDINHDNNDSETVTSYDKWVKSQVEQSLSWGGYLETLMFGGINFQIEHHVAPGIIPIYYYFIYKELRDLCKRHKIKYIYYNDIFTAFYEYERYIFNLNSAH